MRYFVIVLLVLIYIVLGIPQWYMTASFIWQAVLYSFFHASLWHLAANCLATWSILRPQNIKWWKILSAATIAIAVYALSYFRPCIGVSNFLYAYIGLGTPSLRSPWWRKKETMVFIIVTVAMVFLPQISAITHIAAFALGIIGASIHRKYTSLMSDAGRYLT